MTSSNMKWAAHVPTNALATWTTMYAKAIMPLISPRIRKTMVTAGLKCAPETSPNTRISTTNMAPVAMVLPSNATASLPPDNVSPMIPEPTTVASRNAVPIASALSLLASSLRAIDFHPGRRRRIQLCSYRTTQLGMSPTTIVNQVSQYALNSIDIKPVTN